MVSDQRLISNYSNLSDHSNYWLLVGGQALHSCESCGRRQSRPPGIGREAGVLLCRLCIRQLVILHVWRPHLIRQHRTKGFMQKLQRLHNTTTWQACRFQSPDLKVGGPELAPDSGLATLLRWRTALFLPIAADGADHMLAVMSHQTLPVVGAPIGGVESCCFVSTG
jgi:hypothetical protein